jgi:uncharacterized membrane protein
MRGIVMILMAGDHASSAFNANHLVTDTVFLYNPQHELGALPFACRWITHLCAPTFLFLAGVSLALSILRKTQKGVSSVAIDRELLTRGLIILSVDLLLVNWFWEPAYFLLQVMYAIGLALILMIPLRRLSPPLVAGIALLTLASSELFVGDQLQVPAEPSAIVRTFLMSFGVIDTPVEAFALFGRLGIPDKIAVVYPVVPWWAMMALGWAFGRYLVRDAKAARLRWSPARLLMICGFTALAVFGALRLINGYGNMHLLRLDHSLIQWLHVSKYPPSAAFAALELGLMALILSALFQVQARCRARIQPRNPLLLFGQTAFFFYITHIVLLEAGSRVLGMHMQRGLLETTIATILSLLILYLPCRWYRTYKAEHPESVVRFI